jgi:hypothetical protein
MKFSFICYKVVVLTTITITATAFSFVPNKANGKESLFAECNGLDAGSKRSKLCMVASNDIGINGETTVNGGKRKKTKQVRKFSSY